MHTSHALVGISIRTFFNLHIRFLQSAITFPTSGFQKLVSSLLYTSKISCHTMVFGRQREGQDLQRNTYAGSRRL